MTENYNFRFKVGDKVIKRGDPTIYTIKSVFMVRPIYYEAQGELGNIEYLPEAKLESLSNKYHADIVRESDNYNLDSLSDEEFYNLFKYPETKNKIDYKKELEQLKHDLVEVTEMRKNFSSMEKIIRGRITELEMLEVTNSLKNKEVGKYAR